MAGSNGGEGTVEMSFDGADGKAGDVCYLRQLKFLEEAEKEDISLTLGELRDALPDQRHLFARDKARLKRAVAVRNVGGDVGDVDGCLRDSFPEAKPVGPGVVADQIQCDPHEPCRDGTVSTKGMPGGPSADESVLGE